MNLAELLWTARNAGFELTGANGIPITPELEEGLEEDNLMNEEARVRFREPEEEGDPTVIADVGVGQQVFYIVGDARDLEEFRARIESGP